MIINDPKPELNKLTSAYRAGIGPVFIINWAGNDIPERGIYYPSWNPLSPEHVPNEMSERELYVDAMINVLIKPTHSDPHWTNSGRAALAGLVHFMVSKIERARANDWFLSRLQSGEFDQDDAELLLSYYYAMNVINAQAAINNLQNGKMTVLNYVHIGTWNLMPQQWVGREASFPMIFDWINSAQLNIAAKLDERRKQGDQMAMMEDPMRDVLQSAVDEGVMFNYAHRAILELTQLANTPDKERGSILSTVFASLGVFRNAAVRAHTSHSDFHFADLRGMKDANGDVKPATVYLSINQVDSDALNPITGIFIELMSKWLIANPPKQKNPDGEVGPYPVLFVLDEMPKMGKLQAIIEGPDIGRGQQVSYMIIGQDLEQIAAGYSREAMETLMSTTAAKIVLRQNNKKTAEIFSSLVGDKEEEKDDGTKSLKPLFSPMDIMTLDKEKQIVIMQGHPNHPIKADIPLFFKDDKLKVKVNMGLAKTNMPMEVIEHHIQSMGYGASAKIPV
jgi:type IV secretion system protein VirD4